MTTDRETTELRINVLGKDEYDDIITKDATQLYVVKEDNSDTYNSISSRTYADVGRESIYVGGGEQPPSQYTKLWVDLDEETTFVHPADTDMDNLTSTGIENLEKCVAPNFSQGIAISNVVGETYITTATGWVYGNIDTSSELEVCVTSSSGAKLIALKSITEILSDSVYVPKGTVLYISKRSGTTSLNFYPCIGVPNA